ncbi:MAG TPA: amidohydrolase family protein [Chitinophagaceae bacterium]|nr:amidohydrolase family protein [Chitinophagaceae bacterium]
MIYRKFRADRLFDGYNLRDDDAVLITAEDGKIEAIVPVEEAGDNIEQLQGILSPGLVNCHCHLELSHLRNVIPPHTGLIDFLCSVVTKREFDPNIIQEEINCAEKEMYDNGIVAVGDIGNTADTATAKSVSHIYWQNFVEVLGFTDEKAVSNLQHYQSVADTLDKLLQSSPVPHRTSLVPHAPYSISPKTFQLINAATAGQIISIHNQEHPAEDELYKTGGGDYLRLFRIFGIHQSPFPVSGKSSIRSVLPYFTNGQTILLVHNTYMPEEDIQFANAYATENNLQLVYCFCPNANSYIENRLPDIELFVKNNCTIVLGTDSYSSNWQLSIAKEMQTIKTHIPQTALSTLLKWATSEGAKVLQWDDQLGSFEKGKKPGVVLIREDLSASRRLI